MARTIGVKNKNIVKHLTKQYISEGYVHVSEIRDKIMLDNPDMNDIWEGAWTEIDNLVRDTMFETNRS